LALGVNRCLLAGDLGLLLTDQLRVRFLLRPQLGSGFLLRCPLFSLDALTLGPVFCFLLCASRCRLALLLGKLGALPFKRLTFCGESRLFRLMGELCRQHLLQLGDSMLTCDHLSFAGEFAVLFERDFESPSSVR
jgi:hypothetical protein